ncbi:MAG: c-di-GMP phosphodiesterase, partial [Leptospira sp.]|nr:c-di-GMP phosphodiesterase [Leptospira sp.]
KVVNADLTVTLARDTTGFLNDLKKAPMQGFQFRAVSKSIDNILTDFSQTKDNENGLLNILDVMSGVGVETDSEVITKRTVIAMALKIRGMKALSKAETEIQKQDQINMMVSCYLCDIGYTQMKMPTHANLTADEFNYIKNHPMISYLMIAGLTDISEKIKANVLSHHRPFRGEGPNNNYPNTKILVEKLTALQKKYSEDPTKSVTAQDIPKQIKNILTFTAYDEDISIISIAGEYSSLTTNQSWRGAFDSMTAMKMILNNSFFSYNERIVKDFFEYVGVSLCENKSVLNKGDYVITVTADSEKKIHFEICVILEINRTQIRPLLERIGNIQPVFSNTKKLEISGFNLATLKTDRRRAKYNLEAGDPRRIIFIIDP